GRPSSLLESPASQFAGPALAGDHLDVEKSHPKPCRRTLHRMRPRGGQNVGVWSTASASQAVTDESYGMTAVGQSRPPRCPSLLSRVKRTWRIYEYALDTGNE